MGRCGSTLLTELLNSHSQIECGGEILNLADGFGASEFLDQRAYQTERPVRGFKAPFIQLIDRTDMLVEFERRGYRIVRLSRADALDHFLSVKLALLNNNWHSCAPYEVQNVILDPWDFVGFVRSRVVQEWIMDRFCRNLKQHSITYEELLLPAAQQKLLDFLGVGWQVLLAGTVRSRTKTVREIVGNYDELSRFFQSTPYAHHFPEER